MLFDNLIDHRSEAIMKQFKGFTYVRSYGPGERFPENPDFTHMADDSWDKPESIKTAISGLNATVHVYLTTEKTE